jgi:glucose-1-phosphate thymidylyltransferase
MTTPKGIILAGGAGTRLYPVTAVASKQLQPVYDKPMIYYPLASLMLAGIREVLIISTPHDLPRFESLLGDGSRWGMRLVYQAQPKPEGIAQAFLLAETFLAGAGALLILGDNLFYGKMHLDALVREFTEGAVIFGYPVRDPENYGVVEFAPDGRVLSLEEKPAKPKSQCAIPGLYLYDHHVVAMTKRLKPSARGELEITDLNRLYLQADKLRVVRLGRGIAWLDTGSPANLLEASMFIHTIEARQGFKIACPEEIAWRRGFITDDQFKTLIASIPKSSYREYLERLTRDEA